MDRRHTYSLTTTWTGNLGQGTSGYRSYSRDHEISIPGKSASLQGSSDAAFRGDPARYTPEELLVASLSACHMLWFLHLCADAGVVVTAYSDAATGEMVEHAGGAGEFTRVTLRPQVVITDETRLPDIAALHDKAHQLCFVARSVNFAVLHEPETVAMGSSSLPRPQSGSA